jgi:hypothetical protein
MKSFKQYLEETQYIRATDTKRLYRFEDTVLIKIPGINQQLSQEKLQNWTAKIAKAYNTKYEDPEIIFDNGTMFGGRPIDYADGPTIHLIPGHRDLLTLFHELTHFLGYGNHDSRFVKVFFGMLQKYAGVNQDILDQFTKKKSTNLPNR